MALGKGMLMFTLLILHHWRNLLISLTYIVAVDVDLNVIIAVSKLLKSGFRSVGKYIQAGLACIA